jgi:hypothetical protein
MDRHDGGGTVEEAAPKGGEAVIRVARVKEPKTFDRSARKPGAKWLRENPDAARPKDLWSPHLAALATGFDNLCAYAAMLDPTSKVPAKLRRKAEYTLERLKLRDGEKIIRWRQRWYELYTSGALTIDGLECVAPLIAAAVRAGLPSKRKVRKKAKR